jgi:hypothetical protein
MTAPGRTIALTRPIGSALRELVHAVQRSAMYPPGHRFVTTAAQGLRERLEAALVGRDDLTIGVMPNGLLLDGAAIDPLPPVLRDLARKLHRKNIGTVQVSPGVTVEEVSALLSALGARDAEEHAGREGLRLQHVRVEPLIYDVLAFADPDIERELDEVFWAELVEAAFGRRLAAEEPPPTTRQIAEAITERTAQAGEAARRIYGALASFSTALAARAERNVGTARRRFVDVLTALSRPATTRVVSAAPSAGSRRRFLRDTLGVVPPALMIQLIESVAEADGEPISTQLRWLMGKLAGGEASAEEPATGAFAQQVLDLIEQWDGNGDRGRDESDPRLPVSAERLVMLGLETSVASAEVVRAARDLADHGGLLRVLRLLDDARNDPTTAAAIATEILDAGVLQRLLHAEPLDFALIERVALQSGPEAVEPLLAALSAATERGTRRRLLDLIVQIGPASEATLLDRLAGAPWFLMRNILLALARFPAITNLEPVFAAAGHPDPRVRIEAIKVLLRQPASRSRALTEALESGDEPLVRLALTALGGECPPDLVAPVVSVLALPSDDLRVQALRLLQRVDSPLIVPGLLALVRTSGGLFRRPRLAPKSPAMLLALQILATRWHNHRPVLVLLQLAAKSNDPEILAAMRGVA